MFEILHTILPSGIMNRQSLDLRNTVTLPAMRVAPL